MDSTDTTGPHALGPVPTSPARAGLRERVRLLSRPATGPREHVGGRPTALRWSGVGAS